MWIARKTLVSFLMLLAMTVFLAACGETEYDVDNGPDFSGSALEIFSPQQVIGFPPDNELLFSWGEVPDADFYRFYVDPDGHSGFTQFGDDIPAGELATTYPVSIHLFDWVNARFMLESCEGVPGEPVCNNRQVVGEQSATGHASENIGIFSTPGPGNQFVTTFGIATSISEDGQTLAVGANTASLFECERERIFKVLHPDLAESCQTQLFPLCENLIDTDPDPNPGPDMNCVEVLPFCVNVPGGELGVDCIKEIPNCDDITNPNPGVNCFEVLPYCVDVSDPEPGVNCVDELPFCEDRSDPEPGVNCDEKPPFCVDVSDPVPGENCIDDLPLCEDVSDPDPDVNCKVPLPACLDVTDPELDVNCVGELPDCQDVTDPNPGVSCQIVCDTIPEDEDLPDQCKVYEVISNAGGVYIFSRSDNTWDLDALLKAPNVETDDNFGWSVALSDDGTLLAVSAPGEDGIDSGELENNCVPEVDAEEGAENICLDSAGAVYIYAQDADEWLFESYIKAPNAEAFDVFGWDLALSGDSEILAVSAAREATASLDEVNDELLCEGAVYIFARDVSDQWAPQAYLKAPNPQQNDIFGQALSLDYTGSLLAIGASQDPDNDLLDEREFDLVDGSVLTLPGCDGDANSENNTGVVHLFERNVDTWLPLAELLAANADAGDRFGYAVSLNSGADPDGWGVATHLVVGAPWESSSATGVNNDTGNGSLSPAAGAAYLYAIDGSGEWLQTQYLKASNTGGIDQFGSSVQLSSGGGILVVGATGEANFLTGVNPGQEFNGAPGAGAVYVFVEDTTLLSWSQQAYLKPVGALSSQMNFGWQLGFAEDGSVLIVAAPGFRTFGAFPGSVYIY